MLYAIAMGQIMKRQKQKMIKTENTNTLHSKNINRVPVRRVLLTVS